MGGEAPLPRTSSTADDNPLPRLDACCGCFQLKIGVQVLCVFQMIASAFMMLIIGAYVLYGSVQVGTGAGEHLPMLGGAFTLFSLLVVLLLTCAEFGFALYAFSDISKGEPQGIRYYYMFKLLSLALSLLVFMLTSDWTSYEILNLFVSLTVSLYCIWCIWSLHEALMLGGDAAAKAGFTTEEIDRQKNLLDKKDDEKNSSYV